MSFTRIRIAASALVTAVAMVTACTDDGSSTETGHASPAAGCLEAGHSAETGPGLVAVAVDGGDASQRDKQEAALRTILEAGSEAGSRLLVSGLRPEQRQLVNVVLVGEGENQLFRDKDLACKHEAVTAAFDDMTTAVPNGPRDVFGGLRTMASHLSGLEIDDSVEVVLLTSMVNGTEALDMTNSDVLSHGAEHMLGLAAERSLLPNCSGWRVHAVGPVGAGTDLAFDTVLREFWAGFFQRCGGELVAFDTDLVAFPANGQRAVILRDAATGTVTASLSADPLFSPGSADLSPEAVESLNEVLTEIERSRPCEMVIEGHTDNTPHTSNQQLSEDRAAAVRDWLTRHGVDGSLITTRGYGDTRPVASNDDPAGRGRNRRVGLSLITAC